MTNRLTLTRLSRRRRIAAGLPVDGDPCETSGCSGVLSFQNSHKSRDGTVQERYLHCKLCGQKPGGHKWFVSLTDSSTQCSSPTGVSDIDSHSTFKAFGNVSFSQSSAAFIGDVVARYDGDAS